MLHETFLLGADYNPEQWLKRPDILEKDIELMRKANCNVMTLGMFAWPFLEPEDGIYQFDWLEVIINRLYAAGISVILGTPSGARPRWLAERYPEVLRVNAQRQRMLFGERHNHCYTAPAYREKVRQINTKLAQRFARHPAVLLWHLSNEYGGECHCPLCQEAYRRWLKKRYQTLEKLNEVWCTAFWAHTYTSWSQVESPSPLGDTILHGNALDWRRFCCHQTMDFIQCETAAVRAVHHEAKVTINMMYYTYGMNYFKTKDIIDVVSWDSYPVWHNGDDRTVAADTAMYHDIMRSINHEPFLLMESTPTVSNWQPVARQKRPCVNLLSSLQAVAHGSDSVQFFQWRQSVGNCEKFHGAIVNHGGTENTRVFREIAELGRTLQRLKPVCGTHTGAEVAVLFDWENRWATDEAQGPFNSGADYKNIVKKHYQGLWEQGINIDFVDMECSLAGYKLVVAPLLYQFRAGIGDKLREFVKGGGVLVTGPYSGVTDETDNCFLGETPFGLTDVLGLRTVELDGLYPESIVPSAPAQNNFLQFKNSYFCKYVCEVIECSTAAPLLIYEADYYKGCPAVTVNSFGKGKAFYLCSDWDTGFYSEFYAQLLDMCGVQRILPFRHPPGISVTRRAGEGMEYIFILNFNPDACKLPVSELLSSRWTVLYGETDGNNLCGYGTLVLERSEGEQHAQ